MKAMEEKKAEAKKEGVKKEQPKGSYHTLRFRSTGLGKTMLQGEPEEIRIVDDMLVLHIQSTTPVRWRIRAALTFRGLLKAFKLALKLEVMKFILFGFKTLRNPKLSDEF